MLHHFLEHDVVPSLVLFSISVDTLLGWMDLRAEGKSSKRSGKKSKKNQKKQKKKENKKQMYDTIVYTYLLGTCQFLDLFEQEQEKDSLQRYYNLEKKKDKK